ncbi:MAG: transposase [Chloroflexi bacterium]|nr:transposase [Chloroflexota bacterium]MCC6894024.1 transposase [Anaerolineae bacterium]
MLKTFKYRLYPSKAQEKRMFQVLAVCRHWYNMCLEERKLAWEFEQRHVTKSEQQAKGKYYRKTFPQAQIVFSQTLQSVVDDLDKAFQAFFRRVKAREKAGYPRFKGRNRFNSFAFKQFGVGATLDGRRLKLFGIGRVPVRWHRAIPEASTIKTCRIKHQAGQWYVSFAVELPDQSELPKTGRFIGLDMGISALITTSEGEKVENPNYYRAGQRKLRVLSRALARKKPGGKNRRKALKRVQRQHMHVANQRGDYLHKLSTKLVQTCDGVALEDLATRNMVRNPHLSKSILDSGWGIFKQYLLYKAASAGREIRFVDPAYTSQTCPQCGGREKIELSVRWVNCGCGLSLDRDHRAAINVLIKAGWDTPVIAHVDTGRHGLEAAPL